MVNFIKYMYTEVSIEAVMRHQMVSVHSEHVYKLNMYTYTLRCNHFFLERKGLVHTCIKQKYPTSFEIMGLLLLNLAPSIHVFTFCKIMYFLVTIT